MKIQQIQNTNFKGLFTDKSTHDNWKMEYSPYSWEKNGSDFGMAEQTEWNIMDSRLPNNEKHFTTTKNDRYDSSSFYPRYRTVGREECKDILGTEFYYTDFTNDRMRTQIDQVPAMNREDSLIVLNKKLSTFWYKKIDELKKLEDSFELNYKKIKSASGDFGENSRGYDDAFFGKKEYKEGMVVKQEEMEKASDSMFNDIKKYIKLRNSADTVKASISKNAQEINMLSTLRRAGQLIDISRRFLIYDPNKALWDALQNVSAVKDKFIALPDRTISVKELLVAIGKKVEDKGIPEKAIKYVDEIMRAIK